MLRKKKKNLEKKGTASKTNPSMTRSPEIESALSERDTYDDHGPVIIGNRKDKPVFSS